MPYIVDSCLHFVGDLSLDVHFQRVAHVGRRAGLTMPLGVNGDYDKSRNGGRFCEHL